MYSDFPSPSTEFGNNIFRKETCIGPGNIYFCIRNIKIRIQYIFKFPDQLYLIQQDVVLAGIYHHTVYVSKQSIGIS